MQKRDVLTSILAALLALLASTIINRACAPTTALAHGGLPALPTFIPGQTLTATQLNQAFAHVDAPFSGGISDSMIASNASIAHSKLATPLLVPKALTRAGTEASPCDGSAAVDTVTCVLSSNTGVTSIKSGGTAGIYRVTLAYTPVDTAFVPFLTTSLANVECRAGSFSTTAPHLVVACQNNGGVGTNVAFSLVVFDS